MPRDSATANIDSIDFTDHELWRHGFPHDLFTSLRTRAPVWRHPDTPGTVPLGGGFWVLSRHDDVQSVSRDHGRFRSFEGPRIPVDRVRAGQQIVAMDPPQHTRVRKLISAGFTPRMVATLEAQARAWAVAILEGVLERGECNFVQDVAYQLPMHMIADIVGVPESDRAWLFERANLLLVATDPRSYLAPQERSAIQLEIFDYGKRLGAEKRRAPADDVWTILTHAEIEQPDGTMTKLSELELDLFFSLLIIAGSETTRGAISSGLLAFHDHPDELRRLRADRGLMPAAVEEILRWSSPVIYFKRTAVDDTELRGERIAAGERVIMFFPSANRDEEVFAHPFKFDIGRSPNPHVSFGGGGVHFCLGAHLARRQISVLFDEFLNRVADVELVQEPEYSVAGLEIPITVALKDLPVRLTPR